MMKPQSYHMKQCQEKHGGKNMKIMRKSLIVFLAICIICGMVACTSKKEEAPENTQITEETSKATEVHNPEGIIPEELDGDNDLAVETFLDDIETDVEFGSKEENSEKNDKGVPVGGGTGANSIPSAAEVDEI